MSLDGVRRIDRTIAADWDARVQAHESRVSGWDGLRVDLGPERDRGTVTWTLGGTPLLEAPAEVIGTFHPDLGLFRWWWAGNTAQIRPSRLDDAFAHAQRADMKPLLTRQHQLDGVEDAETLCRLAAYFAHASAMVQHHDDDQIIWLAVFTRPGEAGPRLSTNVARTLPPPPVAPTEVPDLALPIREPSRDLLLPVIHVANILVRAQFAGPPRAALLVVNIDQSREKARFFVTLVAATPDGELWAIDTTRDLMDATAVLLVEDARSGNGRWRKLVLRMDFEGEGAAIQRCEVS